MPNAIGYNLALEFLRAQEQAFHFTEGNIHNLINTLSILNDQNRDLQKLIASLTHAKKENKKADFREDVAMQHIIDRVHELNPQIFRTPTYVIETEDLETTLTLLDTTVKDQVSKINETTMYINQGYEDRIQYTENAQKTLEMLMRHIESILAKIGK